MPAKNGPGKALFEYDELVNLLLRGSIGRVVYDIYKLYFPHELKGQGDQVSLGKESQRALYVFLKDFDLCPGLVTKPAVFNMLVNDVKSVPLYTPTGAYILSKLHGKEFDQK